MKNQVAIYLRLSLEDLDKNADSKDESNSITAQRILIDRYVDSHPDLNKLPRIEFCDDGFSGTNFDRPDFQRMIEMAKKGEIRCIVVKDLSRFGRDYLDVGDYLEHIFPFLGIRFISINDYYDSENTNGTTIGLDVAFKNLLYDYYSKDLSKRVKSAMNLKQKECAFVNHVPYGYKVLPENKHQLVLDENTAPIVRRIFYEIIDGKSCTEIAKRLNAEGISTPSEYKTQKSRNTNQKRQWTHCTIHTLIGNIKYTGTMVNHTRESRYLRDKNQRRVPPEEWHIKENAHEAIVTKEEYELAHLAIHRRKKGKHAHHDCSDRVYYCGHCGRKLEKQNGSVFACPSHRYHDQSDCEAVYWKKEGLEKVLFSALKTQLSLVEMEARISEDTFSKESAKTRRKLDMMKGQLEQIKRERFRYYEEYRDHRITAEKYLSLKEDLHEKETKLKEKIEETESDWNELQQANENAMRRREQACPMGELSTKELKKHLYDAVERINIFDGENIEIIWKFDDVAVSAGG